MHYTQDFNTFPASPDNNIPNTAPWSDDTTLEGWYLYRAGNGPGTTIGFAGNNFPWRVTDGSLQVNQTNNLINTGWFYSMGTPSGTPENGDRALGAVPITAQGELSCLAVFQNTSAVPVRLTHIAYNAEIWRTNQDANTIETIAVWWRKAASQSELLTMTSAPATVVDWPANVATTPTSHYVTGWNRVANADFTYNSAVANTKTYESHPVSAVPAEQIEILPNEFFSIRWGGINDRGADALMGLDDLDLTFTAADLAISAAAANVVRHDAGTPRVPGDDTVSFDLTVTGVGAVGAGWSISAPASLSTLSGTYGTPLSVNSVPIAEFTGVSHVLALTVTDQGNPALTSLVQVVAPWCRIVPAAATGFTYNDQGTASPADDEVTYSFNVDGTFTGSGYNITVAGTGVFAGSGIYGTPAGYSAPGPGTYTSFIFTDSADPSCTATLDVFPPAIIGTNATTLSPGPLLSLPAGQNGAIRWNILTTGTVQQTGSTQQTDQVLLSEVVDLSAVTQDVAFTATLTSVTGTSSGFEAEDSFALDLIINGDTTNPVSVLGTANDPDGDGRLRGAAELPTAINTTRTFNFSHLIPAGTASVQVRITGNSNSGAETFNLTGLSLSIPQPGIVLSEASNIIRNLNGPGAADDTVSFEVAISGVNGGDGWITTGATPASGAFGLITLTVPAGGNSATVRITDNTYPGAFADLTVPLPGPYIIGSFDPGSGAVPVFTDEAAPPDAGWTINAAAGTITMTEGSLANGVVDNSVTSEVLSLATAAGAVNFSANLHVQDRTAGFEATDTFLAVLILDGNTANPVILTTDYDADFSGRMNGEELCPVPPVNPTVQDFDYPLSAVIPAGTATVQLVITGINNSANETMIVSGIRFAAGAPDADGDGMSDAYEDANGLDKNNPADRDLDADGDGQSNYLESVAGTGADDPASWLNITGGTFNAATGAAVTEWSSVPGKRYQLQFSGDLTAWTNTGSIITATAATTSASYTVPGAPLTGKGFVRVKVVP